MIDMKPTIIPKSDQLNADDLIGGSRTIKITGVSVLKGKDQPCSIRFEGDNNKPYKPCKSMCRLLIQIWGDDGEKYIGQSMTLFLDKSVTWGGAEVGGIRISHMTGISEKRVVPLTVSQGRRKPYSVLPLKIQEQEKPSEPVETFPITEADFNSWTGKMDDAEDAQALKEVALSIGHVSAKYDEESRNRLNAYYKQTLEKLKASS